MFLDESAFDMEDNPYHPAVNTRSSVSSRPSTAGGSSIDFSKGRYASKQPSDSAPSLPKEEEYDDDGPSRYGAMNSSSSRARMLAQQRDIQLKKRMNAVQAGGMVRSSFENPLAMPGKRNSIDNQSTPAVRQFSAPKAISSDGHDTNRSSEFSGRRPVESFDRSREPTERPAPRRGYADDSDDADDHPYRARNDRHQSSDDDVPSRPRKSQPIRDRSERRTYKDDSEDEDRLRSSHGSRGKRQQEVDEEEENYRRAVDGRRQGNGEDSKRRDVDQRRSRGWEEEENDLDRNGRSRGERDDRQNRDDSDLRAWNANPRNLRTENAHMPVERPIERSVAVEVPAAPIPPDLTNLRAFLTSPIPKNAGIVQCYIRRHKPVTSLYPTYNLYLKDGDRFLLTSKKRLNNKTSNYLISMGFNDHGRESSNYLGKVRSNFVGTEFQIFDNGINPDKTSEQGASANPRKDIGAVTYAANILGTRGPRKMQVVLPAVDENDRILPWSSEGSDATHDDMLARIKDRNFRDLSYLINKPPRWNEQVGAYVLNFNGRVTMASVKNFQLVDPDEQNSVVLQFGRVAKDEFTMDMQWPVSPLQAFAITMTSFDSKIACD